MGGQRKEFVVAVKRKMQLRFYLSLIPALAGLIVVLFTPWHTAGVVLVLFSAPAMFALLRCPTAGSVWTSSMRMGSTAPTAARN